MRFEALRESLLQGGIAPRHARRYLAELDDHLADLTARETDAGYDREDAAIRARAALGDDAMLAGAMLARPGFKSVAARAPWAVFILAPPFAALLIFLIPALFLGFVAHTHGMLLKHQTIAAPGWFREMAIIVTLASNLLLAPLLAILLLVIAHRQRLNPVWPIIGIAIIALFAVHVWVAFPESGKRGGSFGIGVFPLAGPRSWRMLQSQWQLLLMQFVSTLSPLIWLGLVKWRRAA